MKIFSEDNECYYIWFSKTLFVEIGKRFPHNKTFYYSKIESTNNCKNVQYMDHYFHRINAPAIITDNKKGWRKNGKLCRKDGPATIYSKESNVETFWTNSDFSNLNTEESYWNV